MNAEHAPFRHYLDLADARLGSQVVAVSDEWFAPASRMLQAGEPVWKEGVFDDSGKWMDGWETRRKRFEGHDQAVIRLGVPGVLKGVDIDTRFFTGNHPPAASLDGSFCAEGDPDDSTSWSEVLPAVELQGDSHHYHPIDDERPWTHLRLNIYPDGGIARLRLYGVPYRDWSSQPPGTALDLAAAVNGGRALACSDQHFGHMGNLLNPGRAINMGDGWETGRRRTPGHDWVIVALGHPGSIEAAVVDTLHFKGNYPESCSIQAAFVEGGNEARIEAQSLFWRELLPAQKLEMHQEHRFERHLNALGPITHVRLNIFPTAASAACACSAGHNYRETRAPACVRNTTNRIDRISMRTLKIEPLTKEAFAPFGDVIETDGSDYFMINNGSTRRYHKLATVETAQPEDNAIISIFSAEKLEMPLRIRMLERHPLGSQAFIPLLGNPFLVVVAPLGDVPVPGLVRAFLTNGRQGVNYHRGVWHHPVLTIEKRDDFLVVDRSGSGNNCDEHFFTEDEQLLLDPQSNQ